MKRENETRALLISNAIHLIGESGFEGATTKELTKCGGDLPGLKMNEVYIYRLFGSKEELYAAAFACLDQELLTAFQNAANTVGGFTADTENKLYTFFAMAWRFILGNEERCRCYVRYYYSIYFKGPSVEAHKQLFECIAAHLTPIFTEEADVHSILHSVFTALLDFAIRVYNGELEDNDINRPHVFKVLYNMMAPYFKVEAVG